MPFHPIFPGRGFRVRWLAYSESGGRYPVEDFLKRLGAEERERLYGQMEAFAHRGWTALGNLVKPLHVSGSIPIYEIRRHQERVMFCRVHDDAIALDAVSKKNTRFSKKESTRLKATEKLAASALAEIEREKQK